MKYTCSTCGKAFDSRWDCERHEKKCKKEDEEFTLSLVLRNNDKLEFTWQEDDDLEVEDDGSICEDNYQDEDGHDLYIIGYKCRSKKDLPKAKRAIIRAMKSHLREAIKRLGIPEGIDDCTDFLDEEEFTEDS